MPAVNAPQCVFDGDFTKHTWTLDIEEPGLLSVSSGCDVCDFGIMDNGSEDLWMKGSITGMVEFIPDCPNLGGWHGIERCDCGWSWAFTPHAIDMSHEGVLP
jgi:hypothetical protein